MEPEAGTQPPEADDWAARMWQAVGQAPEPPKRPAAPLRARLAAIWRGSRNTLMHRWWVVVAVVLVAVLTTRVVQLEGRLARVERTLGQPGAEKGVSGRAVGPTTLESLASRVSKLESAVGGSRLPFSPSLGSRLDALEDTVGGGSVVGRLLQGGSLESRVSKLESAVSDLRRSSGSGRFPY